MGELILCRTRLAAMPYYIENISLNIYSLEELCYYIEANPDRLDDSFWNEELFQWLDQELKCKELVQELRKKKREQAALAELVLLTLDSCGFVEKKQKRRLVEELRELENKSEFQKGKLRADRHLKNHRFVASILDYEKLLHLLEDKPLQAAEIGSIYHNMGVAYAEMFLYEQAAECFKKAYEYNNHPESMTEMYFALQCVSTKEQPDQYEPPLEWRDDVMTRLQQAVNELEREEQEALPPHIPPSKCERDFPHIPPSKCEGDFPQKLLNEWMQKYRIYSKI